MIFRVHLDIASNLDLDLKNQCSITQASNLNQPEEAISQKIFSIQKDIHSKWWIEIDIKPCKNIELIQVINDYHKNKVEVQENKRS